MHVTKYHWNFELCSFFVAWWNLHWKNCVCGSSATWQLCLCDGNTTHGRSQHCKDFKGKEWNAFILLPRIKKAFLRYLQRGHRRQKKLQWRKAVKVAWSTSHCSKADARETKNNRSVKLQKLYMDKKKRVAIERTTQLVPKKQFGWYTFAIP